MVLVFLICFTQLFHAETDFEDKGSNQAIGLFHFHPADITIRDCQMHITAEVATHIYLHVDMQLTLSPEAIRNGLGWFSASLTDNVTGWSFVFKKQFLKREIELLWRLKNEQNY